jgi:hypothetical protein
MERNMLMQGTHAGLSAATTRLRHASLHSKFALVSFYDYRGRVSPSTSFAFSTSQV